MSYPFVFQMHDHLPMDNTDTHTALWQNWWMREALSTEQNVVDSDLLFYPTGLDLTLQPRRWSTFPLWTLLYSMFGDPFAFNLTAMLGILFKAYGMYLFGMRFIQFQNPGLGMRWLLRLFCAGAGSFAATAEYRRNRVDSMVHAGAFLWAFTDSPRCSWPNTSTSDDNCRAALRNKRIRQSQDRDLGNDVRRQLHQPCQMLASRLWHKRKFWLSMLVVFSICNWILSPR